MRKGIRAGAAALLCAVLCALVLSGCHGSRGMDPFVIPEEFDTSRTYEISFWAKNDTNMVQVGIYEQAIRDFEALYPNITVNLRLYTDYGKIYNDVITNIATQTTPNVCITYPDHIATYLTGTNSVVPLDELFADEKYGLGGSQVRFDSPEEDEIVSEFLSECVINGQHYALPYMRSTEACYVNKTYVEALGYTLPEVLSVGGRGCRRRERGGRDLSPQRAERHDPVHLQIHRQHDDPDAPSKGCGLFHGRRGDPPLQRHRPRAAGHRP